MIGGMALAMIIGYIQAIGAFAFSINMGLAAFGGDFSERGLDRPGHSLGRYLV